MATPAISVLMPVHNAAPTLAATLESLSSQTHRDFELVLVDDGSTDAGMAIARRVWGHDPRLHLITAGRVGLVQALQHGLRAARAELVARLDADDIAVPTRLERQHAFMRDNPQVHVAGSLVRCFPAAAVGPGMRKYQQWLNQLVDHADIVREIFIESPLAHPTVMFRRQAVLALGGYRDLDWPEDYDLWLRAARAGLGFGKVPEVLVHWREQPGRTSRHHPRYQQQSFIRCKAHHLTAGPLSSGKPVVIWGGSNVGRRLGKQLQAEGVALAGFVDIDPRRVGGQRLGLPVWPPSALAQRRDHLLLAAVGRWGARALIRAQATRMGWVEGVDLWCAA